MINYLRTSIVLVYIHLRIWSRFSYILFSGFVFAFAGWNGFLRLEHIPDNSGTISLTALLLFVLPGVESGSINILDFINWFSIHVLFLYIVIRLNDDELSRISSIILIRIGSRLRWSYTKILALGVITFAYTIFGLMSLIAGMLFPAVATTSSMSVSTLLSVFYTSEALTTIMTLFILLSSTFFVMALLQVMLSTYYRDVKYPFLVSTIILIVSALLGSMPDLAKWSIGSHTMLVRQQYFNPLHGAMTIQWSITYNVLMSISITILFLLLLRRKDLFTN